jgi:glycosyltransferase involved in cell wall biosynthesis
LEDKTVYNLAFFPSAFFPSLGGIEEVTRQLAHHCAARGDVTLVCAMRYPFDLPAREEFEGLEVRRFRYVLADDLKTWVRWGWQIPLTRRAVRHVLAARGTELIHIHGVSNNAGFARDASRNLGLPLVVTLHGELTMDTTGVYDRSPGLRRLLRTLLEEADAITACSQHTLEEAERFCHLDLGERGSVIPNGVDLRSFQPAPAPFAHPRPYILSLGRLVREKGIDVLIEAYSRLGCRRTGVDLIIAGEGPEEASLKELARQLEISENVIFVGRADRQMVAQLFCGAEVFVLASRHEPFGIVNLEAMAAGTPIVATSVGGVPELLADGRYGVLVPPEDSEALSTAISDLLSSTDRVASLVAAGRERVTTFTWSHVTDQYHLIYDQALARRTDRPVFEGL